MTAVRIDAQADAALERDQAQFPEWWSHVPPDRLTWLITTMLYRRAYIQGRADGIDVLPRMVGRLMGAEPAPRRERAS
jgi:hypothetical protein